MVRIVVNSIEMKQKPQKTRSEQSCMQKLIMKEKMLAFNSSHAISMFYKD